MKRALALAVLVAACRERELPIDAREEIASVPIARVLYPHSVIDVVATAHHGVVAIHAASPVKSGPAAMYPGAPESAADVALGTGFLVDVPGASPDGSAVEGRRGAGDGDGVYVLTNEHIAIGAPQLRVVLPDGTEVSATIRGRDSRLDLALLALDPTIAAREHGTPLTLGSSDALHVGEPIVVVGDAFGDDVTATAGIVSSTGHDSAGSIVIGGAMGFRTYLQVDARVHRGNSGGPVLDLAGQVVGIALATSDRASELSFAIPINRASEVLAALRDRGTVARSWLGVTVRPITPELALMLGLVAHDARATGAFVTAIEPDSPAKTAALNPGDVILAWGEHAVDERNLPAVVATTPPGTTVTLTLWRAGARQHVQVITTVPQR